MGIQPLFTATATATGGRNGHSRAEDGGSVSVDFSLPKSMGGPGRPNATNPEAPVCGWVCGMFRGALDYLAAQQKQNARSAVVTCSVTIGPRGQRHLQHTITET